MKNVAYLFLVLLLVACTSPYAPHSHYGGYKERRLSEDSFIVSYFGNGNTSEQQVWNYWIYRCAELTVKNGYSLFRLEVSEEHAEFKDGAGWRLVEFQMLDSEHESASNTTGGIQPVQYQTIYVPVTTYSSKAIVKMLNPPVFIGQESLLDAATILALLKPYVDSKARSQPPERQDLLLRAKIEAVIRGQFLDEERAQKLREGINL